MFQKNFFNWKTSPEDDDNEEIEQSLFKFYLRDSVDKMQEEIQMAFAAGEQRKINDLKIDKENEEFWKEIEDEEEEWEEWEELEEH